MYGKNNSYIMDDISTINLTATTTSTSTSSNIID